MKISVKPHGLFHRKAMLITGVGLAVLWTLLAGFMFVWDVESEKLHSTQMAYQQAVESLNKDVMYRSWAAMHGGVYVPVTDKTPPNPYLRNIPERDVTTPSGR